MKKTILCLILTVLCFCSLTVLSACNYDLDCFYDGCSNPICEKSHLYCKEHVCHADNCGLKANHPPYGNYCSEHECKNSNCEKQRFEISRTINSDGKLEITYCDYCSWHKCNVSDCYEEGYLNYEGKNLCAEHFYQAVGHPYS